MTSQPFQNKAGGVPGAKTLVGTLEASGTRPEGRGEEKERQAAKVTA